MKITYNKDTELIELDGNDLDLMENPHMTKQMALEFIEWTLNEFPSETFITRTYLDTKFDEIKKLLGA
jgi:hypothetical protein